MKVRLYTDVASAEGSWSCGVRELPDMLAQELIAGNFAIAAEDDPDRLPEKRGRGKQ